MILKKYESELLHYLKWRQNHQTLITSDDIFITHDIRFDWMDSGRAET
jgi:hypothetical protein